MEWKKLITDLKKQGVTEALLTEKIKLSGVPVTQPTINRLKNGAIKTINYEVGSAIVAIHNKYCHPAIEKSV